MNGQRQGDGITAEQAVSNLASEVSAAVAMVTNSWFSEVESKFDALTARITALEAKAAEAPPG